MKSCLTLMMAIVGMVVSTQTVALASGWSRAITITTLTENNIGGEVVQFTVSEVVDNPGHCTDPTGYAIRDPATLRGSLALLTSAFMTGKQVDLYVTGTCDQSGMPIVIGVTLRK